MLGGSEDSPGWGSQDSPSECDPGNVYKIHANDPHSQGEAWVGFAEVPQLFWHTPCLRAWIPAPSLLVKQLRARVGEGTSPGIAPKVMSSSSRPNTPGSAMEIEAEVLFLALPLASCVTLGKLLDVSVVNFLRYKIGTVTAHSLAGSWRGLQEIVHIHTGLW